MKILKRSDHGLTVCARSGTSGAWGPCCFGRLRVNLFFCQFMDLSLTVNKFLTLRRPNLLGVQRPVSPDLAKTVKAGSDRSEILTNVFGGAENGNFSQKSPNNF